jgi:carbon storage regulator
MLILSRKHGESIVIDGDITVTLVAVKGNVAQLGIDAPQEVPIHRSEIFQRIRESVPDLALPQRSRRLVVRGPK